MRIIKIALLVFLMVCFSFYLLDNEDFTGTISVNAQDWQDEVQQHYDKGRQYYQEGKYQEAQEEFQKALSLIPQEQEEKKLNAESEVGDIKEKLKNHYQDGIWYYGIGEYAEAIREFEEVVSSDADYKDVNKYLLLSRQAMIKEQLEAEAQAKKQEQERAIRESKAKRDREEVAIRVQKKDEEMNVQVATSQPREYTISEEDVLDISVWGWDDLVAEAIVRPDGKISFPLVGDVPAVGRTLTELDNDLTEKLKVYIRKPEVSVMLKKFGGKKVIVLGEVQNPGVFKPAGENSLLEIIALAGGFTEDAVLSSIILIRGDLKAPEARRINLSKAITTGQMRENIPIQPEDIIYVPKKFIANINYFLRQFTPALTATDLYKRWD